MIKQIDKQNGNKKQKQNDENKAKDKYKQHATNTLIHKNDKTKMTNK